MTDIARLLRQAADEIERLQAMEPLPDAALAGDNRPRYTTARMHHEIGRAKAYARREALDEAARLIEDNMVCVPGGVEGLYPRGTSGNTNGLIYAARIRALPGNGLDAKDD